MGLFNKKELANANSKIIQLQDNIKVLESKIQKLEEENKNHSSQSDTLPPKLYDLRNKNAQAFYCVRDRNNSFFSTNELTLFDLLSQIIAEKEFEEKYGKYLVFPKVRLIDIIKRWWDAVSWDKLQTGKKTAIASEMKDICGDFKMSESNFAKLVFYPLLRTHVDFFICLRDADNTFIPALVIELNGKEHDDRDYANWHNDVFKKAIFDRIKRIELWKIENDTIINSEKIRDILKNKLEAFKLDYNGIKQHKNKTTATTATVTTADPTQTENESRNNS